MYRSTLRQAFRDRYGINERGSVGRDRINRCFNLAIRELWKEAPEVILRDEMRLRLEPALKIKVDVAATDALVLEVTSGELLTTNGTLRGRWIDIVKNDQVYSRRIRDVFTYKDVTNSVPDASRIVLDEPWENRTDADLSARIHTYEYMLPADVAKVTKVIPCTGQAPSSSGLVESVLPEELVRWRVGTGWTAAGKPQRFARGNVHRVDSPHYTPAVATPATLPVAADQRWGYDNAGTERGGGFLGGYQYGAAGTFSYRECLVWGRSVGINPTQEGSLRPWLISSPTAASAQVTSTWAGSYIRVRSPDVAYIFGYGPNPVLPSYHHAGLEKWIFRARHETQDPTDAGNNAAFPDVENDDAYYLWRIVDASTTETYDRGDDDPPDRRVSLRDFQGHISLRFDRTPEVAEDVIMNVVRRPPEMVYDSDPVLVPSECVEALLELTAAYVTGDRDGEPARKSEYYRSFKLAMEGLRNKHSFSGHDTPEFGDGLSARPAGNVGLGPIREL